jgi:hypothetical protein
MEVRERDTALGKRIEIRSVDLASEGTEVSPSHVVCHNEQDIGPL